MGPSILDPAILLTGRPNHARAHRTDHGQARGPLDRRRDQFPRFAFAVRSPLGRHRAASVSAFRALLLSGHRLRHRPPIIARRSWSAGRAQNSTWLSPDDDLLGALHR